MRKLEDTIIALASELPSERIMFVADAMESMPTLRPIALRELFSPNANQNLVRAFVEAVTSGSECSGKAVAQLLRLATGILVKQRLTQETIELIWTGPATTAVPVRHTETALCELIDLAQKELFIVSFVTYKVPRIMDALIRASSRDVVLKFLVEPSKEQGGHVDLDSIANMKSILPHAIFYRWYEATNPKSASIHAKCAVADHSFALITSANLTGMAMDCNMELGVLVKQGLLPKQLFAHLQALVTEGVLIES